MLTDRGYVGVRFTIPATKFGKEYAKQEFGDNWDKAKFRGQVVRKIDQNKYVVKYDGSDKEHTLPLNLIEKYIIQQ